MRSVLVGVGVVGLLAIGPAYGQPCAGYPASKTWQADPEADPGTKLIHDADGGYPGWAMKDKGWGADYIHEHPVTVDSLTAQRDRIEPDYFGAPVELTYSTEDSGWTVTGGDELSLTWQVHISEPATHYPKLDTGSPRIRLRNGVGMLELAFEENVTGVEGCVLSGWVASSGTIEVGGREIPNQLKPAGRYLPMAANEWHTIRVDLHADGSFDAWVDGGGSDWKHASGTTSETSDKYIQFSRVRGRFTQDFEFSAACVAWGEGADEIPAAPPSSGIELCENGLDDDADEDVDCDDSDCDCPPIADECMLFMDMIEHFNVEFVDPENPPTDDFKVAPGWSHFGYGAPMRANAQVGLYDLPPKEGSGSSSSQKLRIAMDLIATECGTQPECYADVGGLERDVRVEDIVGAPVDWTRPVKIMVDATGLDFTEDREEPQEEEVGKWQTFLTFEGYTGTGGPDISHFEWGDDGHPHITSRAGFLTHRYILDPGQRRATGTFLRFGLDFNFNPPTYIPPDRTNSAFFENVRIVYTYDPTAPLLALDTSAFDHSVFCETLPDDTFTISNEGGTTLTYTITDDADWLSVTPESGGPLANGESDVITVMYDLEGLGGPYTAAISVSSDEAFWSPVTIEVALLVDRMPPDYDCDGDADQEDFGIFQGCYTGPDETPTPGFCAEHADLAPKGNPDGHVDIDDVVVFQECASGPGIPFIPECVQPE